MTTRSRTASCIVVTLGLLFVLAIGSCAGLLEDSNAE